MICKFIVSEMINGPLSYGLTSRELDLSDVKDLGIFREKTANGARFMVTHINKIRYTNKKVEIGEIVLMEVLI